MGRAEGLGQAIHQEDIDARKDPGQGGKDVRGILPPVLVIRLRAGRSVGLSTWEAHDLVPQRRDAGDGGGALGLSHADDLGRHGQGLVDDRAAGPAASWSAGSARHRSCRAGPTSASSLPSPRYSATEIAPTRILRWLSITPLGVAGGARGIDDHRQPVRVAFVGRGAAVGQEVPPTGPRPGPARGLP